ALYFYFNSEEFAKTGQLWAWPSLRTLNEQSGRARNTVRAGLNDLAEAGYLEIHPRYDRQRKRSKSHRFLALEGGGSNSGKITYQDLPHPGSAGSPPLGQPGVPYFLNDSKKDSIALREKEGEFEEGSSGRPLTSKKAAAFVAAARQKTLPTADSI